MSDLGVQQFLADPVRITVEYRRTPDDEGPAVRVFGKVGNQDKQVLRFDCFQNSPHYHYDPEGSDEQHHMEDESITDPVEWTLHRLERNLADMIRRAGYGELADQIDPKLVAEHMEAIRDAISSPGQLESLRSN